MLSRYSHVRMEAKRRALDKIAARQRAADEKRKEEAARREEALGPARSAVVQAFLGHNKRVAVIVTAGRVSYPSNR